MFRHLIFGLALLGVAPTAYAQGASLAPAPSIQPTNAMQLSRLLNPSDRILAASDRAFAEGFQAALAQDKASQATFSEHPKLLEAILAGASPVVRKHVSASVPALQEKSARFYAGRFTTAEIDQLIAFYGSPTGSKFIEGMYSGLDMTKVAEAMGPDGKDPIPADALKGALASAALGALPSFDLADWKRFTEFTRMPVFAKVRAATPDMVKLMTEIANEPSPELDAEIEQVVGRVIEDYFAKLGDPAAGS